MSDRYKGAILSPTAPTVTQQSAGGIYTSSQQLQYQGQGVWPQAVNYPINNSLRFRSSASAYLNRTPASSTNRTTWTWSAWVKRGDLVFNSDNRLFGAGTSNSNRVLIGFENYIAFVITDGTGNLSVLSTTSVYRDPAAWYHLVVAFDSTQATASNRVKIYVNGSQVTAFSTATYPPQNTVTPINSTDPHVIGTRGYILDAFYDGYMAEVNFVDGVALTPSSFGTTDAYGIWQPIPYTGSYGTNGFYLPFTDNSALTTSSNVGLGKDFSGNGNYWTTNGISITAGSTYDSMKDVPTNTNSNTANYCVWNAVEPSYMDAGTRTISNGNLTVVDNASSYGLAARGTLFVSSAKWYWEINCTNIGSTLGNLGLCNTSNTGMFYQSNGYRNTTASSSNGAAYGASYTTNDVIGVALDLDSNQVTFYKNNTSQGVISISAGSYTPAVGDNGSASTYTWDLNCGQRPFAYTPPTGFLPLNTYNLPTPTILDGDQYMDATLFTATAGTNTIVNAGGFQPDLVWIKSRNNPQNNYLVDSVRGGTSLLQSNITNAESIYSTPAWIISFNSNGFTSSTNSLLTTSYTYVGWQWRASNAAGVSNTQGTITSTVSANTTAGFSIVTYSGNGTSGATVGHGLGVAPSMYIVKTRSTTESWITYHISIGATNYLALNLTQASSAATAAWNNTAPTSTVFSLGNAGSTNGSGNTFVAYCFSAVAGYSAFGSYTGNGSTDGPFIYLGFRPRFVMFKSTGIENWIIHDTARDTYNVSGSTLIPNLSDSEYSNNQNMDILSNGVKMRSTNDATNTNGVTYTYACFAENPFKIARAR